MDNFQTVTGTMGYFQTSRDPEFYMFKEKGRSVLDLANFAGMEALIPNLNFVGDSAIIQVCNTFGKNLVIDRRWCDRLRGYVINFSTRKVGITDYGEFFGSPYLGLHKPAFTTADRNEWFDDIWDVDEQELKENLHECKWVNKNWAVTGDVFNLTVPYLLYKIYHSKLIDAKVKHQAMVNVLVMYHFKCLTSIIHNDYKFLARKEVAKATYEALSLKYDIKKYGSWRALFIARAEFILDPKTGIHFNTFTRMDNDKKIIYMVGDIQDRLRGVVNDINKVFHDLKNKNNLVRIDDGLVKLEEGLTVKEISKQVNSYKMYLANVLSSRSGFYKEELINEIVKIVDNAPQDKLERIIRIFPDQYNANVKRAENYRKFVDEIITHLFEYLTLNDIDYRHLKTVIYKMMGAYNAPRSQNDSVLMMRELGDTLVQEMTGVKTRITYSSLRTALMLYIVLRTLTKEVYS